MLGAISLSLSLLLDYARPSSRRGRKAGAAACFFPPSQLPTWHLGQLGEAARVNSSEFVFKKGNMKKFSFPWSKNIQRPCVTAEFSVDSSFLFFISCETPSRSSFCFFFLCSQFSQVRSLRIPKNVSEGLTHKQASPPSPSLSY